MKPTKFLAREKKNEATKAKKEGRRESDFKPKNYLEILLSAHPQTLQADILHLDQKATKSTTCKPVCGKF